MWQIALWLYCMVSIGITLERVVTFAFEDYCKMEANPWRKIIKSKQYKYNYNNPLVWWIIFKSLPVFNIVCLVLFDIPQWHYDYKKRKLK